jgi:hypothetical protein
MQAIRAARARPGAVIALTGTRVLRQERDPDVPIRPAASGAVCPGGHCRHIGPDQPAVARRQLASAAGATLVDDNLEDDPLGDIAARSGGVILGPAAAALIATADALILTPARWTKHL